MRRLPAALFIATLVVLAGCAGSLPGGEPTLDDVEYPPGVADSRTNATALLDAHESALDNRSFTLHLNSTGSAGNRSQSVSSYSAVSADRDRMRVHADARRATMELYVTPDTIYRRNVLGNQTRYDVRERTGGASRFVPTSLTGEAALRRYLAAANFTPSGVTVEDGTPLVVLTADAAAVVDTGGLNVTRFDARVLVDERGVVHRAAIDYAATGPGNGTLTTSMALRVTNVGETDVTPPDWLDEAEARADSSG